MAGLDPAIRVFGGRDACWLGHEHRERRRIENFTEFANRQNAFGNPACSGTSFAVCRLFERGTITTRFPFASVHFSWLPLPGSFRPTGALQNARDLVIVIPRPSRHGEFARVTI